MATDAVEKKAGKSAPPPPEAAEQLPCPRCDSTNTKFCYYNNYNFSQPRHFCKSCRRYWTHGGTLRDIPVGGGSRKNAKRPRTSAAAAAAVFPSAAAAFYHHHRHLPVSAAAAGSFTTLLNSSPAAGIFGFDDVAGGFGLGRAAWPFAAAVDGGAAAAHTWQMESGEGGFVGGDCFGFPDLAISTPAGTLLK